jgi:protein dithiol:quinone oxidoreductase
VQYELNLLRLISILSFSSVVIALVSQYVFEMLPCAWCVFQRLLYLLIGLFALWLSFVKPTRVRMALGSASIVAITIMGVISAWYQEKVAANTFSCAQTLADQIMKKSGLDSAAPWLFGIYASCMDARVKLFGIEYAWWSLAMFILIGITALVILKRLLR